MADPAPNNAAITQSPRQRFALTPPAEDNTRSRRAAVRTMDQPFTIISDAQSLADACHELQQAETAGLDCETTDLEPRLGELRLIQLAAPHRTYVIDVRKIRDRAAYAPLKRLLEQPGRRVVCQHGKFEQKWLKHCLDIELQIIFDTLIAAQLADFSGEHNLEALAKKYLNITLDKTLQASNWQHELSEAQLQYAARDAQILLPLREALIPILQQDRLIDAAKLEFDCITPLSFAELAGIHLNKDLWEQQTSAALELHAQLTDELQEILAAGALQTNLFGQCDINLNSHPEVAAALRQMGVPIENATREAVLLPLKDDYPVVAKLLEYRAVQTSVASFGKSWLDLLDSNHRVFPDFAQIGAPTGRMSCSTPNVQQVPTADEYRQCFDAPAGRSLVLADYSQIELRILAEFSGDEKFIDAFQSGSDLHRVTASQVFSVSIDDVTKDQRDFAKRLNFGVVYGIGAARFARMTGVSLNVAEEKLRKYFATYRKLDDYLREASNRAVNQRCTRTGSGRLIRFRFDPHDRQAVSEVRRRGRNSPIQGTGADILKRALRRLHDDLRDTTAKIVNIIHDEIVIECDDTNAPEIADRACKQMVGAGEDYLHNVPVVVEPKIARQWIK